MANLFVTLLVTFTLSSVNSKVCEREENGRIIQFCCDNSERREDNCIDCLDGYISTDGKPCQPCEEGFFGRKCVGNCRSCNATQRYYKRRTTKQFQNPETNAKSIHFKSFERMQICGCKNQNRCWQYISCNFIVGCVNQDLSTNEFTTRLQVSGNSPTTTTITTTTTSTKVKTAKEFDVGDTTLYSLAALGATNLIVICFCIVFMARCYSHILKKRANNKKNHQQDDPEHDCDPEQGDDPEQDEASEQHYDTENVYDYVDENAMFDQIEISRRQNVQQIERTSEKEIRKPALPLPRNGSRNLLNDGYLQPVSSASSMTNIAKTLPNDKSQTSLSGGYLDPVSSAISLTKASPKDSSRTPLNDGYLQPVSSTNNLTGKEKSLSTSSSTSHQFACVTNDKNSKTAPLQYQYMQLDRNKTYMHHYASRQPVYLDLVDDKATPSGVVGGSATLPGHFRAIGKINRQSKSDESVFVNTTLANSNNDNRRLRKTF